MLTDVKPIETNLLSQLTSPVARLQKSLSTVRIDRSYRTSRYVAVLLTRFKYNYPMQLKHAATRLKERDRYNLLDTQTLRRGLHLTLHDLHAVRWHHAYIKYELENTHGKKRRFVHDTEVGRMRCLDCLELAGQ